ncbi:glycosyltransferase family 4 protein [Fervidobacterium pennivorans subsp. carthaginiensis]|uniref:glycosyltransferase family 4 protein n=1 Tax=Fervidobacterium pennivorans TaxID=93466 RepID=UPI00355B0FA4
MTVYIFYSSYLDDLGEKRSVGGVQTYISMLSDVVKEIGMVPVVYQFAKYDFDKEIDNVRVVGVAVKQGWSFSKKKRHVFEKITQVFNDEEDILIFATDYLCVKNSYRRVIAIQHGVAWDIKRHENWNKFLNRLYIFKQALGSYIKSKRHDWCKTLVCVDYNFLNWYRTQLAYIPNKVRVIPNAVEVNKVNRTPPNREGDDKSDKVKIIFARRFVPYRGTRIFTDAIKKVLEKFTNVEVTIAGDGPDRTYMEERLRGYSNVKFIEYDVSKTFEIHSQHDIAVVPSIGSEGTSFSLLEAMASGCAVIATNVGGMTNIIINRYNGILVNPAAEELYEAIEELIQDSSLRNRIGRLGRQTVECGFNLQTWKDSWKKVLLETAKIH